MASLYARHVLFRPAELEAIRRGEIDLAFRRWDRPRVKVGTRLRTAAGLLEVVSVDRVALSALRAEDAHRAGAPSLSALKVALAAYSRAPSGLSATPSSAQSGR